jgi:uncharacterized protein (DUF1501 family)
VAAAESSGSLSIDKDQTILVLIQLAGGNDGLNTVIPFGDPEYHKARPGIGIGKDAVHKLDDFHGLHPAMSGFKELFDDGHLSVLQGVGYPNPNRSHFRSTDIWHCGDPLQETVVDGWLGRALDLTEKQHAGKVPALALSTGRLPLALVGTKINVPMIRSLAEFKLQPGVGSTPDRQLRRDLLDALRHRSAVSAEDTADDLDFLRNVSATADQTAEKLEAVTADYKPCADYPNNGLGSRLKTVAQLIASDLGTRIFFVSLGGFDTHSKQEGAHQALLSELSSSVHAFLTDLQGHKLVERVLVATYSEFGRRVKENGSLGTDHGAASQMFVLSSGLKGGIHGKHPSLTDLAGQDDLKFHTDFRSVYTTLLDKWLGFPAAKVLGQKFAPVDFI